MQLLILIAFVLTVDAYSAITVENPSGSPSVNKNNINSNNPINNNTTAPDNNIPNGTNTNIQRKDIYRNPNNPNQLTPPKKCNPSDISCVEPVDPTLPPQQNQDFQRQQRERIDGMPINSPGSARNQKL